MTAIDGRPLSSVAMRRLDEPALEVDSADIAVSLLSFAASLALLIFALSLPADFQAFIALHAASLVVQLVFLVVGR